MDITEIIERLKNIAEHAVHTTGEEPFVMGLDDGIAVHEAIELLEKAETNLPEIPDSCNVETVEAIPVEWIERFLKNHEEGLPVYNIITRMLEAWREEQNEAD